MQFIRRLLALPLDPDVVRAQHELQQQQQPGAPAAADYDIAPGCPLSFVGRMMNPTIYANAPMFNAYLALLERLYPLHAFHGTEVPSSLTISTGSNNVRPIDLRRKLTQTLCESVDKRATGRLAKEPFFRKAGQLGVTWVNLPLDRRLGVLCDPLRTQRLSFFSHVNSNHFVITTFLLVPPHWMTCYDPYSENGSHEKCLAMLPAMQETWALSRRAADPPCPVFVYAPPPPDLWRQGEDAHCGVFSCIYALSLSRCGDVPRAADGFTGAGLKYAEQGGDILSFRGHIASSVLRGSLAIAP